MKIIPLFKVSDMRAAIKHYTEVLDFRMTWPGDTPDSPVVDLGHEEMEFQITTHESDGYLARSYTSTQQKSMRCSPNTTAVVWTILRNQTHRYTRGRSIGPGAGGNFTLPMAIRSAFAKTSKRT